MTKREASFIKDSGMAHDGRVVPVCSAPSYRPDSTKERGMKSSKIRYHK